ncbi:hypothetical protein PHLCEN_2v6147 [Hermanssonia centrifuga]|uniref:Alpha-amylase n=1 Tax=Hermanssonia centrifuga TaxID=98765 RepID=A0A2R6P097_9APHY|nr:hypothetical protein PHLCEN_2v6147 [Hermanssonia centrifuga]
MRSLCLSVLLILLVSHSSGLSLPAGVDAELDTRAPTSAKNVIVQMFEWTWDSVAAECTNFLGPAGYGFVQVSPPQEHVTGTQWWTDYQPVSYTLTSKRGDRSQFANMITTCHAASVQVIADTIFNHMTGSDSGSGVAGSTYTHYVYPGIYQNQDFHHCGLEPGDDIVNYDNRLEVQTCELENLADLATDTEYVRSRLATYANDLLSLGVDGLRLDAAKHMASTDIANITSRFTRAPYITQEVIYGAGEPITPNEYTYIGWVSGTQANVFVTNHDTERNGNSLNNNSPSNTYVTAMIFSLAHPFGTPTILSSYTGFTDTDAGAPNGGAGTCTGTGGTNGWLCQHRWVAISGMVGFHNNVGSAALVNWVSPQSQQIAFGRGALGFVAINNADSDWTATFTTSLPAGSYCDVISGTSSSGKCTGLGFTVSGGTFSATVPARSAIAIHTGALGTGNGSGTGTSSVTIVFQETATTTFGENIFLVGSTAQLGSWDPDASIALSSAGYPTWSVSISMTADTAFDFKFIRKETDGSIVWESDPNRSATAPASGSTTVNTSWR